MEKILARGWRVSVAGMCVFLALSSNAVLAQTVGSSATISGVVLDPAHRIRAGKARQIADGIDQGDGTSSGTTTTANTSVMSSA